MIFAKENLKAQWSGTNPITTQSDVNVGGIQFGKVHFLYKETNLSIFDNQPRNAYQNVLSLSRELGNPFSFPTPKISAVPTWGFAINDKDKRLSISYTDLLNQPTNILVSNRFPFPPTLVPSWPLSKEIFSINTDIVTSNVNTKIGINPILFSEKWTGFPDIVSNGAEISNDVSNYKTLMIVGNKSAGIGRRVSIWDILEVNGSQIISNTLQIGSLKATYHPDAKLHVAGKVAAQHFVITKPTNWSDKVFDKNYKLLSLPEIEQFIFKNKHLPDVPSEKEVMEKGYDANEMDAILLQKIEELTLLMIELKKENEALKKDISNIKR
jgi:hypothetical protein